MCEATEHREWVTSLSCFRQEMVAATLAQLILFHAHWLWHSHKAINGDSADKNTILISIAPYLLMASQNSLSDRAHHHSCHLMWPDVAKFTHITSDLLTGSRLPVSDSCTAGATNRKRCFCSEGLHQLNPSLKFVVPLPMAL